MDHDDYDDGAASGREGGEGALDLRAMPPEEQGRIGDVVLAVTGKFAPWPAFVYHPGDVQEELKRKCFKVARAKDGFGSHHIIFYYGYGANGFNAVPFKNVLPWTEEHLEEARKGYKRDKKFGLAVERAEQDIKKPREQRAPGPPDKKAVRKMEREARKRERGTKPKRYRGSGDGDNGEDDGQSESGDESEGGRFRRGKRPRREVGEELPGTKKERAQAKVTAWWTKNGSRFPSLRSFSEEGQKRRRTSAPQKKTKKDFKSETPEERFRRLSRNLKILVEDQGQPNIAKICTTLEKLAGVPVTLAALTETGAGQMVKELRKHINPEIQNRAKGTFSRWKATCREDGPGTVRHDAEAGEEGPQTQVEVEAAPSSLKPEAPSDAEPAPDGRSKGHGPSAAQDGTDKVDPVV